MKHRVNESLRTLLSGFWTWELPRCGGCILLGMALQKRRFFHGEWSRQAYAAIAGIVTPVGWALTALGVLYNDRNGWTDGRDFFALWGIGVEFNYWGSLLCTIGYMFIGVLLAFWAADPLRYIFRTCLIPIRSVGRTALSTKHRPDPDRHHPLLWPRLWPFRLPHPRPACPGRPAHLVPPVDRLNHLASLFPPGAARMALAFHRLLEMEKPAASPQPCPHPPDRRNHRPVSFRPGQPRSGPYPVAFGRRAPRDRPTPSASRSPQRQVLEKRQHQNNHQQQSQSA